MIALVLALALGALLLGSAALKAAAPVRSADALATFGIRRPVQARVLLWALVAVEAALGVAVAAGWRPAAWAAAALMLAFAAALAAALASGRAGRPCACLGPRSRVGRWGLARNLLLAAGFVAVALGPRRDPTGEEWVAIGLILALAAVLVLAVMVLALAREVADLRLAMGPQMALELDDEGPPIGAATGLTDLVAPGPRAVLATAVFTSEGCHMCRALEPAVEELARDPLVGVRGFDEHHDAEVWREHDIPGSPYAVVLSLDGIVLAKGTFNSFAQLQGMLATAERRGEEVGAGGR
ncbi:MAG: hypothetical protein RIB67_04715 [Miltoncostaeaceae bacterium]